MKRWRWCGPILAAIFVVSMTYSETLRSAPFDWPQWQGPERTAVSKESGLLQDWPKGGPPLVWKANGLGGGYSTPSVANGHIFGMSYRNGKEGVWALDEKDGKELWWTTIANATKIGYDEGSRCTPTVDGDVLYAIGTNGDLVCLGVKDGKEVWHKNLQSDFGGKMMSGWGYSESPLIDGDKLICTPGGKDATILALNKKTADVIWKCQVPGGDGAAYASAIAVDFAGSREYVQFLQKGVVGVEAASGKFLWRYAKPANGTANCSTAIYSDGTVFAASAYGVGGGLVKLSQDSKDGGVKAEEVFFTKNMENHHGGMILHDGYLYGANGGNSGGYLICLEYKTGKVMWNEKDKPDREGLKKGSVAFADGRIYYRQEDGKMSLIEPSPKGLIEHGRFDQPDRSKKNDWAHPVIANGKLYLHDQDVLLCYDIKKK
jgi:outer membrane protein assembly factor BamB